MRPRPVEEGGKAERTICTSIWSSRASSRASSHTPNILGAPSCRQAPLRCRSSSALQAKTHQNSVRDRFSPSPSVPVVVAASCARRPAHSGVAEECLIDQAHLCSLAQAPRAARHRPTTWAACISRRLKTAPARRQNKGRQRDIIHVAKGRKI